MPDQRYSLSIELGESVWMVGGSASLSAAVVIQGLSLCGAGWTSRLGSCSRLAGMKKHIKVCLLAGRLGQMCPCHIQQ